MHLVEDGRFELSNNATERAIKPLTLGRKNYLFAGSDEGGRRAAILYTLIGTAHLTASTTKLGSPTSSPKLPSIPSKGSTTCFPCRGPAINQRTCLTGWGDLNYREKRWAGVVDHAVKAAGAVPLPQSRPS